MTKEDKALMEIAKKLKKKHEFNLYAECLEYASKIYELTKQL